LQQYENLYELCQLQSRARHIRHTVSRLFRDYQRSEVTPSLKKIYVIACYWAYVILSDETRHSKTGTLSQCVYIIILMPPVRPMDERSFQRYCSHQLAYARITYLSQKIAHVNINTASPYRLSGYV
jgi:hypothetical protein